MKQLKFEHQFAQDIKDGSKTATFRVNEDKDIRPGDIVELVDKVSHDYPTKWEIPGELEITEVTQVPISELSKEHMLRAESFDSTEEMVQTFQRFYGEHVGPDTLVHVLSFRYRPFAKPRKYLQELDNMEIPLSVKLYADGGSRGNPGPSALGYVILDMQDTLLHQDNKYLGITTNNQAEYHALLAGLEWCRDKGVREVKVYMDSMLVVNQLNSIFKVKNRDLWTLYETAKSLSEKFRKISFTHVPRELNKLADAEVNKALDAVKGSDIVQ